MACRGINRLMLTRTPLSEAAFDQLCDALKAEIKEQRDVAQQRYHDVAMLTIALDPNGRKMRLHCSSGLSMSDITSALVRDNFVFEDFGAFLEIHSIDWQGVVVKFKLNPKTAVMCKKQKNVITVKI